MRNYRFHQVLFLFTTASRDMSENISVIALCSKVSARTKIWGEIAEGKPGSGEPGILCFPSVPSLFDDYVCISAPVRENLQPQHGAFKKIRRGPGASRIGLFAQTNKFVNTSISGHFFDFKTSACVTGQIEIYISTVPLARGYSRKTSA